MAPIELPDFETATRTPVERAIASRASRRSFAETPVSLDTVARVLWAAQGITHERDGIAMRAAPSAGATYPLTAFLEVAPEGCTDLTAGVYRYAQDDHTLETVHDSAVHHDVARAALGQSVVGDAPAVMLLAADYDKTRREYPDHGDRYVHMEAGHAAENVHLVCASTGLASCPVGAFSEAALATALQLPPPLSPVYLLPFGHRST
ncbi:MAG: SagB/ThcOx family dehydrogenase [Halobacteriota archaeon]